MSTCTVPGCERPLRAVGLCNAHYVRKFRGKPLDAPVRRKRPNGASRQPCCATNCYRESVGNSGKCSAHYRRWAAGKVDWDAPLTLYRKRGETADVSTRIRKDVAELLKREAKAEGRSLSEWLRIMLEERARVVLSRRGEAA